MSAENYSFSVEGFLRDVLFGQFGNIPTCQKLKLSSCKDENVLKLKEVQYLSSDNPGRFALAYSIPNLSASPSAVGCLGMEEIEYVSDDEFSYYEITGGENAGFKVPLEETCDENQVTVETCKKTTITYKVSHMQLLTFEFISDPSLFDSPLPAQAYL